MSVSTIIICALSLLCIILFIGIRNLLLQNEALEDLYRESQVDNTGIRNLIQRTLNTMRDIDSKGAFESDDEVGVVFDELKNAVELLNKRIGTDDDHKEGEQNG
jgi:hypothetical protein